MKYIQFLLLTLLGTQCLAMDVNQFVLDKEKRILMNNIVLGSIENINFEKIPKNLLDQALYIACCSKKHTIMKELIQHGASVTDIHAQLALLHAKLNKDLDTCTMLSKTPLLPLPRGLFWAVFMHQTELVYKIFAALKTKPETLDQDSVKLALIYADFLGNEDIVDYFKESIEMPSESDALVLATKHKLPDVVYEILLRGDFEIKTILDALEIAAIQKSTPIIQIIFQHIVNNNLIEGTLEIICEHDLSNSMNALFEMSENNLRLALTVQELASKYNAQNVLEATNKLLNTLKPTHPRMIAVKGNY